MDTRKPRRVINALSAFWERIGYLMERDRYHSYNTFYSLALLHAWSATLCLQTLEHALGLECIVWPDLDVLLLGPKVTPDVRSCSLVADSTAEAATTAALIKWNPANMPTQVASTNKTALSLPGDQTSIRLSRLPSERLRPRDMVSWFDKRLGMNEYPEVYEADSESERRAPQSHRRGRVQDLVWIRSDGSVEPAGIRATFSQKWKSGWVTDTMCTKKYSRRG
ncbi:hypothetical protein EVAR_5339_1 [Eumeta japonica]|uniref:Uncharacterized protein n=1 Tax=Eumeta variegata TaxID=151549 RepID=A0A4C1TN58_EUMVA|nr:hypothetical protein EVAR_5339_1 [Eumeta japonica]